MINILLKIIKCEMFYLLRFKYRLLFFVSTMLGIMALFPLLFIFGQFLANILGIPPNTPARDHPYGLIFLAIFLFALTFFTVVGSILGNIALAIGLIVIGGYSKHDLKDIFLQNKIPKHWLIINK